MSDSNNDSLLFQDEWVDDEEFSGWLVKVSNDDRRGYCRVCQVVLQAKKSELHVHARLPVHQENLKVAEDNGTNTSTWASVQIVSQDEEQENGEYEGEDEDVKILDDDGNIHVGHNGGPYTTPTSRKRGGGSGSGVSSSSKSRYAKKYRPAWEEEPEFKLWLQAYTEDTSKAFCKACSTILRAHKHDLTCHARTIRHHKRMQEVYSEAELYQMQNLQDHKASVEPETIHVQTSGIFPDNGEEEGNSSSMENGHNNNDNEEDDLPIIKPILPTTPTSSSSVPKLRVVKLSKDDIIQKHPQLPQGKTFVYSIPSSSTPPGRSKRPKVTATDIVAAIENNEFTGYELLQIVKAAVPKL